MEAPAITRYRRPFLAPLWLILVAALAIGVLTWSFYRGAGTTVIVLLRPAERAPGTIADPPLSAEGEERAQRLARLFSGGNGQLDAIYVTDSHRAQQTAAPLAERLHRTPMLFAAADASATAARLLREHAGGTVLVIGAGDALPQMIYGLAGAELGAAAPDESEFIYVVSVPTFGRAHLLRLKL